MRTRVAKKKQCRGSISSLHTNVLYDGQPKLQLGLLAACSAWACNRQTCQTHYVLLSCLTFCFHHTLYKLGATSTFAKMSPLSLSLSSLSSAAAASSSLCTARHLATRTRLRIVPTTGVRTLATSPRLQNVTPPHSDRKQQQEEESAPLTGADKLLQDALRLEQEEEAALLKKARAQDPNDVPWTGEERVQDLVLRMVMDKYKPLRVKLGEDGKNPADEKIKAGIQTPTAPGTPPSDLASISTIPGGTGLDGTEEHEDGRRLPKTPDEKPWRAVYVRPPHLGVGSGDDFAPSIYYGQFLKSSSSVSLGKGGSSEMRAKLKAAGVNVSALPLDDPKAMTQLRQGIKTAERRGKLLRARDRVLDYQLSKPFASSQETHGEQEAKGDEVSDTNQNLQLQLGHAQGWDSVVEKRIKAAQDAGLFKENKLRGKPIERDMEEKNPFLAREEYFMNRIVKRQGAAPPWVELNMELETELGSWRQRFTDSWVRRASRMITTSTTLASGLEPLPLPSQHGTNAVLGQGNADEASPKIDANAQGAEAKLVLEVPAARTAGEQALVDVATRYRDEEWEQRERAYHVHELKRLNDLIRKHNHLAPFTARKGLMILDVELAAMYTRALPRLVFEISTILRQKLVGGADGSSKDGWDDNLASTHGGEGLVTYDMWGREVKPSNRQEQQADGKKRGLLDGWWGNAVGSRAESKYGQDAEQRSAGERGTAGQETGVQSLGLIAAIQKSLQWAKQRIGT